MKKKRKPREPQVVLEQPTTTTPPKKKRKPFGLGLTSFILAVITLIAYIIMAPLGTAMIEPYVTPEGIGQPPKEALEAMTSLAAVFIFIIIINLIGFILGMVGSFSKTQKKSYSIIGAIINGIILITFLVMFTMLWAG